jgi:hypothetical protein
VDEELALFIATEITTHWNAIGNSLNNGNQLIENKKKRRRRNGCPLESDVINHGSAPN